MDQFAADEAKPTPQADSSDLLTQLVTGPSLHEVACATLRTALAELYPDLAINPDQTLVVKPTWQVEEAKIIVGVPEAESLTDALVRHGTANTPVTYLDGEHFLTVQPNARPMPHLPVRIDVVGQLMNELIDLLFVAYQEQQLDYWNQQRDDRPRWHELAQSLRAVWKVSGTSGWNADQQALARLVFDYPDPALRAPHDTFKTRVCLVDIDHLEEGVSRHRNILELCVIIGSTGSRTMILTHSVVEGFRAFDSLEGLNTGMSSRGKRYFSSGVTQWRLYEPNGDFFQVQACAIIALQGQAIARHDAERHRAVADSRGSTFSPISPRYQQVENNLPDWLLNASPLDQTRYSRLMMDLALVQQQNPGQTFLEQVPPINEFALKALRDRLLESHPDATGLDLEKLRITITSVVVWGTFVPGTSEETTFTLVELALENLIALPLGSTFIDFSDGAPVPDWMTDSFVRKLVTDVNIGRAYPALIKQRLVDDPVQSKNLQTLYTRHLKIQLPMLALQLKLCGEAGLDDLGCSYVAQVFEEAPKKRSVGGQEIVIRPLAFVPHGEDPDRCDTVCNMYVIGPRDADQGPCLLYRPLMDNCLLQYPTPANLIYAIKHSHRLRKSILAWLPDNARANYANFIFPGDLPSVWSLTELLVNPTLSLQITGPVSLGTKTLEGDRLAQLFKSNANALVELADRQSVSNAESHWATLKQGAWKLFNGVLPFLGPTLGTAAWIWQIMDDVQEIVDARQESRRDQLVSAVADLFLNVGMVLAHHAATRGRPAHTARKPLAKDPAAAKKPALEADEVKVIPREPVKTVQAPDLAPAQLPEDHALTIHVSGALNGRFLTLNKTLAEFKVDKPEGLGDAIAEEGPEHNLYRHEQRLYAPVGKNWFEVQIDDYDNVQIIDSRHSPERRGPLLTGGRNGKWYIDIRLRLRGGGLGSRRVKYKQQKAERINELRGQVASFNETSDARYQELSDARTQMKEASTDNRVELTRLFLEKVELRSSEYEAVANTFEELNRLDNVPRYRLAMVKLLGSQLYLNQSWIDALAPDFNDALRKTFDTMDLEQNNDAPARAIYQRCTTLLTLMINKIEFADTTFDKLLSLGKEGAEVIRTFQSGLPEVKVHDLKAFQLELWQALCLKPETTQAALDTKAELERIVDTASMAIETSKAAIDTETSPLDERIEALNEQVERFSIVKRQLADIAEQSADLIIEDQFTPLRERINAFSDEAAKTLSALLLERKPPIPVPGPSRVKAPAPKKKVIKTRTEGIVAGEERTVGEDKFVDVKAPVSGKTLATFHQKKSGEWFKRVSENRPGSAPKPNLGNLTKSARQLLDELEGFIARYTALAEGTTYLPVEIDEAFQRYASEMSTQAERIAQALSNEAGPSNVITSAESVRSQLQAATNKLFHIGHSTRVKMIMQRDPTAAHVEWLKRYNEIDIVSTGSRRRLKGQKKDFLQEYEIRKRQSQEVLWYAHFHYGSMEQAAANFTAAHLKTREQRKLGGTFDLRTATNDGELLRIYRSEISPRLADQLFFNPDT